MAHTCHWVQRQTPIRILLALRLCRTFFNFFYLTTTVNCQLSIVHSCFMSLVCTQLLCSYLTPHPVKFTQFKTCVYSCSKISLLCLYLINMSYQQGEIKFFVNTFKTLSTQCMRTYVHNGGQSAFVCDKGKFSCLDFLNFITCNPVRLLVLLKSKQIITHANRDYFSCKGVLIF